MAPPDQAWHLGERAQLQGRAGPPVGSPQLHWGLCPGTRHLVGLPGAQWAHPPPKSRARVIRAGTLLPFLASGQVAGSVSRLCPTGSGEGTDLSPAVSPGVNWSDPTRVSLAGPTQIWVLSGRDPALTSRHAQGFSGCQARAGGQGAAAQQPGPCG